MNYDETDIPIAYDRGRDHGPEVLNLWMNVVSSHVKGQRIRTILDLGCGTGRFSEALAVRFDAEVIGVDPSTKMLEQARSKQHDRRSRYGLGHGESIPLPADSVDLVFISMVFHLSRIRNLRRASVAECFELVALSSCEPGFVNALRRILTLISSRKAFVFLRSVCPQALSCARFLRRLDFARSSRK